MASSNRLRRAVVWAAGIGLSNRLLRKRIVGSPQDANTQVPTSPVDHDPNNDVYALRGETVSVGGMIDWVVASLARRFAQSKKRNPRGQWKDLKTHIKSKGMKKELRGELGDVDRYFKLRDLTARAGIMVTAVAEATQMFRLSREKGKPRAELVTVDQLREESAAARAGYDAIQTIGRALDGDNPTVLTEMDDLVKGILLGRI